MKLTEVQRCIIAVNIIGVILEEYNASEISAPIRNLKYKCEKFRDKQSGVEQVVMVDKFKRKHIVPAIVNAKQYDQYMSMNEIGDRIWKESIDHFAKQKLKIDAVSLIESIYLFNENILTKHAKIRRNDLDAYRFENQNADKEVVLNGTATGGHLMGLLMREMGIAVNGKLRALRLRIEDQNRMSA
jgi:hypothetical protein